MTMIYLKSHPGNSIEHRAIGEWNGGSDLHGAVKYLGWRWGYTPKEVVAVWRRLGRQWGCRPVGFEPGSRHWNAEPESKEYTDWKGTTGPGKLLRDIVAGCDTNVTGSEA